MKLIVATIVFLTVVPPTALSAVIDEYGSADTYNVVFHYEISIAAEAEAIWP